MGLRKSGSCRLVLNLNGHIFTSEVMQMDEARSWLKHNQIAYEVVIAIEQWNWRVMDYVPVEVKW